MSWTAPGDNGFDGTAVSYEVRYKPDGTFAEQDFNSQLLWTNTITPSPGGSTESHTLSLDHERTYYFALVAVDDKGLKGSISNIACGETGWEAPAAVSDLSVVDIDRVDVTLSWTASGDNGNQGRSIVTHLRYATQPLTDDNWDTAESLSGLAPPLIAGSEEIATLVGLNGATTYYFGVKIEDDKGLLSPLSNIVSASTEDTVPPAPVLDLSATASSLDGVMILSWTASGENGDQGSAGSVELRYHTGDASDFEWGAATAVNNVPVLVQPA